ncbi:MAG: SUKH-3 domain-containing protein [Actinophytocola sp.]|uniref:SUKH-3 domain-containing protein n=1 Tax=Actinophytocola sp. TaxID=1872138 RepID=UPI003C77E91F
MGIVIGGRGRQLAEEVGWQPERAMDVSVIVHEMISVGFDVSPAALRFLTAFSGLRIVHSPSIMLNDRRVWSWTEFDPKQVRTERGSIIACRCAEIVDESSLCPVGINSFHFTIYISPAMRFFAGMDSSVYGYGDSVDEFFARLVDEEKPVFLGSWAL